MVLCRARGFGLILDGELISEVVSREKLPGNNESSKTSEFGGETEYFSSILLETDLGNAFYVQNHADPPGRNPRPTSLALTPGFRPEIFQAYEVRTQRRRGRELRPGLSA